MNQNSYKGTPVVERMLFFLQAVKIAHKHGCSLAIFAPAWTHEAIPEESAFTGSKGSLDPEEIYEHFLLRDRAFWGSIWRYLNTKLPCELPFQTSFCRGQGLKRRLYGEVSFEFETILSSSQANILPYKLLLFGCRY